jgi:hypothetical protein
MSNGASRQEPWYSVRSLFLDKSNNHYEERTILIGASSHKQALELAEMEAAQYCEDLGAMEYLGYSDTFHIFGDKIESGTEVFSLIRKTQMSKDEYVDRFLDSGLENRSENID